MFIILIPYVAAFIRKFSTTCTTTMSPGASSQSSKSKSRKNVEFDDKNEEETGVKNRSKKVDEGDGFDVVESDPDEVTSSDDDGDPKKIEKKAKKAKKEAERVKRRLEEIAQVF